MDLLKKIYPALIAAMLLPAIVFAQELPGDAKKSSLSLFQAYELALRRSEDIAIQAELIEEAEGIFRKAFGGILPKIHYVITEFEQDAPETAPSGTGATTNLLRKRTPQKKFTLSQPIFSGFKEFAALQGASALKMQRRHEKKRAEELLFVDVAGAFYGLLESREDLTVLNEIHETLQARILELDERVKIGRSRESEIKAATVDLKLAEADRETVLEAEDIWRRLLEFYIGRKIGDELTDEECPVFSSDASVLSINQRSDVLAAQEAYRLSDKNVGVATAGLFPKVTLDGNAYTERIGVQSEIDWDVLLTVDVPIFEGTEVIGTIKSAAAKRGIAKQTLSKAKRVALREAEDALRTYGSSCRRETALQEAKQAAQENAALHAEEYRNSLVSNLDFLQSLRFQGDTALRWNAARYETKINYWKLKIARGDAL